MQAFLKSFTPKQDVEYTGSFLVKTGACGYLILVFSKSFISFSWRENNRSEQAENISHGDQAEAVGVQENIGRYERSDACLLLEWQKKIADTFEVSLDYLAGESINSNFDKKPSNACRTPTNPILMPGKLFFFIDIIIRDSKAKKPTHVVK